MLRYKGDRQWLLGDDQAQTFVRSYEAAMAASESNRFIPKLLALLA
jgi:hypothetical protein